VFASDSRLSMGSDWDCCPKILTLPRSDALIAFAGDTHYAYPLALQLARSIELYPASHDRRVDLFDLKGHCIRVFNQMRGMITDLPAGERSPGDPATWFLFGGYSWRFGRFAVWTIHWDAHLDAFTTRPAKLWRGQSGGRKLVVFAGDVSDEGELALVDLLRKRNKLSLGGLDMEPFEVLRDLIRSGDHDSIGGAPQIAKVYRYLQTQQFAVRWPTSDGVPHVMGRPALDYEDFVAPAIDPDRPEVHARVARETTGVSLAPPIGDDQAAWSEVPAEDREAALVTVEGAPTQA